MTANVVTYVFLYMSLLAFTSDGAASKISAQKIQTTNAEGAALVATKQKSSEPKSGLLKEKISKYAHSNTIPYRSKKNLFVHLLSLPAKIWRLAWTPLGATVIWAEQNRIP